ncbi:MAG: 6-phosphogluconate dehydrogenase (decarboxylating), partial [Proteobacteria bacterium]
MQIGMIGLGRMGANMVRRLMRAGHECVVYDRRAQSVAMLVEEGAQGAESLAGLVARLAPPRVAWIMVPAGAVGATLDELRPVLARGDIVVDGGNSNWRDAIVRARELQARGVHFVDVGTSGGVFGLQNGYCLMIGGEPEPVDRLEPLFAALAPPQDSAPPLAGGAAEIGSAERGWLHCGPAGGRPLLQMGPQRIRV